MKCLVLLAIVIVGMASAARADFAAGLRSYEAGDYYSAYKEWLLLADAGGPAAFVAAFGQPLGPGGAAGDPAPANPRLTPGGGSSSG